MTAERIVCAAIWYKDLVPPHSPTPLSLINPKNVDRGIVFCGFRHGNCLYTMVSFYGLRQAEAGEEIQGFLTSKNRFVDRKEAATIALASGQITSLKWGDQLYSEDLY